MPENNVNPQPELLTVEPQVDSPCYFLGLTVENVRSFSAPQTLDLSDGNGRPAQWVILLGDNGAGKTTLLQCLSAMVPSFFEAQPGGPDKSEIKRYAPEILLKPFDEKYRSFFRVGSEELRISVQLGYGAKLTAAETRCHKDSVFAGMTVMGGGDGSLFPTQANRFLVWR